MWILVEKMSLNCKISGLKRLNLKLKKKGKEPLHVCSCVRKWMRRLLFMCLLGSVIFCFFYVGGLRVKEEKTISDYMCEEEAQILLQQFNVSSNQLHDLVYLLSQSDQVTYFGCTSKQKIEYSPSNDITCALKVLCSGKTEFYKQHRWVMEILNSKDQCPIQDDKPLSFPGKSASSSASPKNRNQLKKFQQRWALWKYSSLCLIIACCLVLVSVMVGCKMSSFTLKSQRHQKMNLVHPSQSLVQQPQQLLIQKQQQQAQSAKVAGKWRKKLLKIFVFLGITGSIWIFWHLDRDIKIRRIETLTNMCDERARMLQDQFNVSLNHVHALAILVSTFHHGKHPSAIDQKTFGEYTERTSFERPLTSGVAYALRVPHSEREEFEKQHGWTIKKMETEDQTLVQDYILEKLDPAPVQDEYAPVILSQETVSHIVSLDMMSGKEDRENILRARASGKGVLTSPFKLLKSNYLGVVLTFTVYNTELPPDATPEQRIEATMGYLGASYDVPSLVEKLLHQLASKQTIVVNVYDTTNRSSPINMYGTDVVDTGLSRISKLDFGDPLRQHEMHCRFKQKPSLPWTAINAAVGVFVITLLVGYIFHAAVSRIAKVEEDYRKMRELKVRAEAADVAKSQFLATVSHEIRTPMNGVLGMLQMLMDTNLDANQLDFAQTAHASGKELISLINEVLDQAKIESCRLELEAVPFDPRAVLDIVLSFFSGKSHEKGIELAAYISDQVPEVVIGDPGRFRQIITNLVGNSIKFTDNIGHIFVSVHLAKEVNNPLDIRDQVLTRQLNVSPDTLSGSPTVDRWKSWETFEKLSINGTEKSTDEAEMIMLLVSVEDTGVGIPTDAQSRIFKPFMQADSSTSRTYGGTGIGLSISKCLVKLMDGEIGFVSEPGIGSTFSFIVALRRGKTSVLDTKWLKHYDSPYVSDFQEMRAYDSPYVSDFQGMRALVVDKRRIRAEVTRYHLQRLGIFVDIDYSLESACSFLSNTSKSTQLEMVLIDKDVWDKKKFSLMLKNDQKRISSTGVFAQAPKIFLLATSISLSERTEIKLGGIVDNILLKPLRLSVLVAFLQESLGNGKKHVEPREKPVKTLGILLKGKKILIVDDNGVNRRVAEGALKRYGAIVTCVDSGKSALLLLKPPHNFDVCFMDLQMPEMDGFEATRQIRYMESNYNNEKIDSHGDYWHTPVLAMTADTTQATNEECMKCGMDDYVSKPFEEDQLCSAISRVFQQSSD